jgi:hypothetical protein
MPSELHQIPLRVDDELYNRIVQYLARMQRDAPGVDIHRTDAVRQLVIRGLEAEAKAKRT